MLEALAQYIETGVEIGRTWGPLIIFTFMTIESSFIPFPSEIIMIPAGIMIALHQFPGGDAIAVGLTIAIACGLAGSMAGAYVNYYLSLWLGRPFLHRYGKYFFLKPHYLDRAEALFREYGEITTFVCRLLPAIRQLISIPAGLSRMNVWRFSLFTALGAGLWVAVLTFVGYGLGSALTVKDYNNIDYYALVVQGKDLIKHNLHWLLLGLAVLFVGYVWGHKRIMHGRKESAVPSSAEAESRPQK